MARTPGLSESEIDPNDIVHRGGLDGVTDFRVFRLRCPRRSSTQTRILKDWYVQEAKVSGKLCICLVGNCEGNIIRTSPVLEAPTSTRAVTANCTYILTGGCKVLENPIADGLHKLFACGFPANWKDVLIQKQTRTRAEAILGPVPYSRRNSLDYESKGCVAQQVENKENSTVENNTLRGFSGTNSSMLESNAVQGDQGNAFLKNSFAEKEVFIQEDKLPDDEFSMCLAGVVEEEQGDCSPEEVLNEASHYTNETKTGNGILLDNFVEDPEIIKEVSVEEEAGMASRLQGVSEDEETAAKFSADNDISMADCIGLEENRDLAENNIDYSVNVESGDSMGAPTSQRRESAPGCVQEIKPPAQANEAKSSQARTRSSSYSTVEEALKGGLFYKSQIFLPGKKEQTKGFSTAAAAKGERQVDIEKGFKNKRVSIDLPEKVVECIGASEPREAELDYSEEEEAVKADLSLLVKKSQADETENKSTSLEVGNGTPRKLSLGKARRKSVKADVNSESFHSQFIDQPSFGPEKSILAEQMDRHFCSSPAFSSPARNGSSILNKEEVSLAAEPVEPAMEGGSFILRTSSQEARPGRNSVGAMKVAVEPRKSISNNEKEAMEQVAGESSFIKPRKSVADAPEASKKKRLSINVKITKTPECKQDNILLATTEKKKSSLRGKEDQPQSSPVAEEPHLNTEKRQGKKKRKTICRFNRNG